MSIEELQEKISIFYDPTFNNDDKVEASKWLDKWQHQDGAIQDCITIIRNNSSLYENFVALLSIKFIVCDNWLNIDSNVVYELVHLLFDLAMLEKAAENRLIFIYSVRCLMIISILSMDIDIQMPDFAFRFDEKDVLLCFAIYFEEFQHNYHRKYLSGPEEAIKRDSVSLFSEDLLKNNPMSVEWLIISYSIIQNLRDFENYEWMIERITETFGHCAMMRYAIEIISCILVYENQEDYSFYYTVFSLCLSFSEFLRNDTSNEQNWDYLMLLWSGILNTRTNYMVDSGFKGITEKLLQEFSEVIKAVPIENELWEHMIDALRSFCQIFSGDDFIQAEALETIFQLIIIILERGASSLPSITGVLNEIWTIIPEYVIDAISSLFQTQSCAFFSLISCIWPFLDKDNEFTYEIGIKACDVLISMTEYSNSALDFIIHVGYIFPEYYESFVTIIINYFYLAKPAVSKYALWNIIANNWTRESHINSELYSFLLSIVEDPFPKKCCFLIPSIIILNAQMSDKSNLGSLHSLIISSLQNVVDMNNENDLVSAIRVLSSLIVGTHCLKNILPDGDPLFSFFDGLFNGIMDIFDERICLSDKFSIQSELSHLFEVFCFMIDIKSRIVSWVELLITHNAFDSCHVKLIHYVRDFLPIPCFYQYFESYNPQDNIDLSETITKCLFESNTEKDSFWIAFPLSIIIKLVQNVKESITSMVSQSIIRRLSDNIDLPAQFLNELVFHLAYGIFHGYSYNDSTHAFKCIQFIVSKKEIENIKSIAETAAENRPEFIQDFYEALLNDNTEKRDLMLKALYG